MRPDGGHGDAAPSRHLHRLQALRGAPARRRPGGAPHGRQAGQPARPLPGPPRRRRAQASRGSARRRRPTRTCMRHRASDSRAGRRGTACANLPASDSSAPVPLPPSAMTSRPLPARYIPRAGRAVQAEEQGAGPAAGGAQSGMRGVLAGRAGPKCQAFAVPAGRPEPAWRAALGRGNTGYGTEGQPSSRQEAASKGHAGKAGRLGAARAAVGTPAPPPRSKGS